MSNLSPLHVSYSAKHGDGGIAFAIADLLAAQQRAGVYSRWLTADQYNPWYRDQKLYESIANYKPNILHCHGLWRSHTRIASRIAASGTPTLIAPHGMMDSWAMAHASWKKELVWQLWEKKALNSACCLHAVCKAEADAIHERLPHIPVVLIPNGVSIPSILPDLRPKSPWDKIIPSDQKVLLFLGRFHPKKGLEPLMSAWQSVLTEAKRKSWWLVCVGFGDDGKFQSQLENYPIERCLVRGPLFGAEKAAAFRNSTAFILPSFSEGLPMAALEAMSFRLPCLLSSACNLPEAFDCNAALRAEPDASDLIDSLLAIFSQSDADLETMGENSFQLVKTRFDWKTVAKSTTNVYQWMLGKSSPPECLIVPHSK